MSQIADPFATYKKSLSVGGFPFTTQSGGQPSKTIPMSYFNSPQAPQGQQNADVSGQSQAENKFPQIQYGTTYETPPARGFISPEQIAIQLIAAGITGGASMPAAGATATGAQTGLTAGSTIRAAASPGLLAKTAQGLGQAGLNAATGAPPQQGMIPTRAIYLNPFGEQFSGFDPLRNLRITSRSMNESSGSDNQAAIHRNKPSMASDSFSNAKFPYANTTATGRPSGEGPSSLNQRADLLLGKPPSGSDLYGLSGTGTPYYEQRAMDAIRRLFSFSAENPELRSGAGPRYYAGPNSEEEALNYIASEMRGEDTGSTPFGVRDMPGGSPISNFRVTTPGSVRWGPSGAERIL